MCSSVRPDGWRRVTPFQIFEFQLHGCGEGRHRERERERERQGEREKEREREGGRESEREREGERERGRVESRREQVKVDTKTASSATERANSAEL